MDESVEADVLSITGATEIVAEEMIQSLWSGYGEIVRVRLLRGAELASVVVKHIRWPELSTAQHPRGWNTSRSHQRKVQSYRVELAWYQQYANRCCAASVVPECLGARRYDEQMLFVLTDLHEQGFGECREQALLEDVYACLAWLAHFHATYMQVDADGLWPCGSYWHLDTRPDEWAVLEDERLKQAAPVLDQALKSCSLKTLIHGDAKLANFCFTNADYRPQHGSLSAGVAAVDFQYVGAGCGMIDVAYFIGSCVSEADCERLESHFLDFYFDQLRLALCGRHNETIAAVIEDCWRPLYVVAWADFYRFLKGWSPEHWKVNSYCERMLQRALVQLKNV